MTGDASTRFGAGRRSTTQAANDRKDAAVISPELVRKVADKVYAMWLLDLKVEQERWQPAANRSSHQGGR